MRFFWLLFLSACASQPSPPIACPDIHRVVSSTTVAPRGLSAEAEAYWALAVEWAGEAKLEAAAGDEARRDVKRLRGELAAARKETAERYTGVDVLLFVVGAAAVGFVAGAATASYALGAGQ